MLSQTQGSNCRGRLSIWVAQTPRGLAVLRPDAPPSSYSGNRAFGLFRQECGSESWAFVTCLKNSSSRFQTNRLFWICCQDISFLAKHLCFGKWGSVVLTMLCSELWIYVFGNVCIIQGRNDLFFSYGPPHPPPFNFSLSWLTVKVWTLVLVGSRPCHSLGIYRVLLCARWWE